MSKINILEENICNQIAAGEVIERPSSVVKELVENSIDAGATDIRVEVERGGVRLIRVADNGSGMDEDDAMLCLEPHGTSKIRVAEDLQRLSSLGFRGEAIPSIASVAKFTLRTRQKELREGTEVAVAGGKILGVQPCGIATGTEITVSELFFNVPARRKFLRSAATEEHHIEEVLIGIALCYPSIGFALKIDGRNVFTSPGDDNLDLRIRSFFGKNYAAGMWKTAHKEGSIGVHGYIAAPGFTRSSRKEQRTFVNGRIVESQAIYRGIKDGYAALADKGAYPPVILFLELPPEQLDVNVHPAKREVRFQNDFAVSRAVACAVGNALRSGESSIAQEKSEDVFSAMSGKISLDSVFDSAKVDYEVVEQCDLAYENLSGSAHPFPDRELVDAKAAPEKIPHPEDIEDVASSGFVAEVPLRRELRNDGGAFDGNWPNEVLGILDDTYILAAAPSGLILVDQHAAHERILFEKMVAAAKRRNVSSQRLLLPSVVELPVTQAVLLLKNLPVFTGLGFEIEPVGGNSVMLTALPLGIDGVSGVDKMFSDMLSELAENSARSLPVELEYVARAACKAAIKAHNRLTLALASSLLDELKNCEQGTLCPHGRPTMVSVNYNEITRRFGRK